MVTPDAPREPQPCQYGVDHDQNICGRTPTKLFLWPGDRYAWRCEPHDPTRSPSTDAVLVDAPREPVARDADLERIHDAFRHGGTSEGFALSQVEQLCREARDERDALVAERERAGKLTPEEREWLLGVLYCCGPLHDWERPLHSSIQVKLRALAADPARGATDAAPEAASEPPGGR